MNRPKKLVSHIAARILQAQSIRDTWIFIGAIRNRKPKKFFVKKSSYGTEYLVIINGTEYLVIINGTEYLVIINGTEYLVIINGTKYLVIINGTEYLVIINDKERTFKNDKNAYCTYDLHSFIKNLPYCQ